ncbi:DUF3298 and DUF4163 domain-containing protein [Moheibacter sediminis]|uniref:DUF3298 domain-containing protein n=1 Tax=Moheibacter sediminis TaxID=1434700 RepID=A0A1W2BPH4_9FLAO|nr:DUF3298 and DUF4163 domain-containing protein [Moheibacter sediminis]SMC74869.1 protein of unknown function [Moheibacter sediminis]
MKFLYFSFFCLILSIHSFAQKDDYLILEGKIGEFPVSMELTIGKWPEQEEKFYNGNYYYHSQEIPIDLYQADSIKGELNLTNWEDENAQEFFKGKFTNGIYKGIWTKGNKSIPFELKKVSAKYHTEIVHFQNSKVVPVGSNAGTYEYDWYLPKDLKIQRELVWKIDSTYTDFHSYTKNSLASFEEDYTNEIKEYQKDSDDDSHSFMMNYAFHEGFSPVVNSKNYLVMRYSLYQYTGGAHGMSHEIYFTYNKKTQKWMEISDVLNEKYVIQINMVVDKALRKEHNIQGGIPLQDSENSIFISDEITYSKNFTLSKNGITFHYGLYELTPYAYGYFSQFVPYEELKMYLNQDFKY